MIVSCFSSTFAPYLVIPNAPKEKSTIHYPVQNIELIYVLNSIKNCKYEKQVTEAQNNDEAKKRLPCFTPSGVFRFRNDNELLNYSNIICLDFDKLDSVYKTKQAIIKIPYTMACFISPSYKGLKVFVKHNGTAATHKKAYDQIKNHYENLLNIKIDKSGSNISRLCYVSFDRDLYMNESSEIFQISKPIFETSQMPNKYKYLIDFTTNLFGEFNSGNRNNFIFLLANNCNRYGLPQYQALAICRTVWIQDNTNFSELELESTVKKAYQNIQEFGKFKLPNE